MENPSSLRRRSLLRGAAASTLSVLLPWQTESAHAKPVVNAKPMILGNVPPVYNPAPDIIQWLGKNPNVAAAIQWQYAEWGREFVIPFTQWPQALQNNLVTAYNNAYVNTPTNLPLVPTNIAAPSLVGDPTVITTILSTNDAQALYLAHVAHSLAVELRGDVPWSLTTMSDAELQILFNSQKFFTWNSTFNGYECSPQSYLNWVVPAPPDYAYSFLLNNGIISLKRRIVVGGKIPSITDDITDAYSNLLAWCGDKMSHYLGGVDLNAMQEYWQYPGMPPAARVIQGTFSTDPAASTYNTAMHWTCGCHGTSGFIQSVARTMNIAVEVPYFPTTGHQGTYVPALDAYLSHGDDPYDILGRFSPALVGSALSFPRSELLINSATYNSWYTSSSLTSAQINNNVGRRPTELAVQYLPLGLLYLYLGDKFANIPPANGQVFTALSSIYTLAQLQGMNLWQNMDAKIASLGGANALIPIYNNALLAAQS